MIDPIKSLIVDDVEHQVADFSPQVQSLVVTRNKWMEDLLKERSAVVKTEAAIRQLDLELTTLVQQELSKDKAEVEE